MIKSNNINIRKNTSDIIDNTYSSKKYIKNTQNGGYSHFIYNKKNKKFLESFWNIKREG